MPKKLNFKKILDLILFGLSYLFLYFHFLIHSGINLVPWDVSPEEQKAPLGTLARSINDYFEVFGHIRIPALFLLAITLIILLFKYRKTKNFYKTIEESSITNILYITSNFVAVFLYVVIKPISGQPNFDPILITIDLVFLLGFYIMQCRGYKS